MSSQIQSATSELLRFPLPGAVGGSGVTAVDVVAVDLTDTEGVVGHGFSYGLDGGGTLLRDAAQDTLDRFVAGQTAAAPASLWRRMEASFSRRGRGLHLMALAAIDVALWDLHAKQRGLPLALALGGEAKTLPVYASGGYRPGMDPEAAAARAREHADAGFPMVKPRLNGNPHDLRMLRAIRDALPEDVEICTDVTERCDVMRAQWLCRALADLDVVWLEEPLKPLDYAGHATLARISPTPIATGERLQGLAECLPLFREGSCAVIQPDLSAMGGLSECLRVAQVAEAFGIACAPHFLPALFVHLGAVCPNLTWLEDFPLLEPMFDTNIRIDEQQRMAPGDRPGHGLEWADGAREEYRTA